MAKVTRKKLPRGVKLTVDHVFDPIEDMKDEIVASSVDTSQRKKKYGTFRVNFNIPWIDSKYFYDNRAYGDGTFDAPFYIPFCLPPLQEHFDATNANVSASTPTPKLTSVGLSFDQSDERGAILGQWYGKTAPADGTGTNTSGAFEGYQVAYFGDDPTAGGTEDYADAAKAPRAFVSCPHLGKKNFSRADAYDLELSILEKEQIFFKASSIPTNAEKQFTAPTGELLSLKFPSSNYIAEGSRFNPLTIEGLSKEINPYKTYIMALKAPRLHDTSSNREHCALVNIWVTLKFKMELVPRDTGSHADADVVPVQNMPLHDGAKGAPSVTITKPSAGETIKADDAKGIVSSVGLEAIDQEVRNKIQGGYGDFSMTPQAEASQDSAAYEVITVPLGQGFPFNRMSVRDDYPFAPYVRGPYYQANVATSGPTGTFPLKPYVDRRIIPITQPMTIHHVVFAMNYTTDRIAVATNLADAQSGRTVWYNMTEPNDTIAYKVGLGMVSGVRSDGFNYQQVAYATWVNNNSVQQQDGQIDSMSLGLPANMGMHNEYKLMSVPLVSMDDNTGVGYWDDYTGGSRGKNGKPFFVGDANSYTQERTRVGSPTGGAGVYAFSGSPVVRAAANGTEQYLEVRFSVDPTNGGANIPYAYNSGATDGNRIEWQSPTGMNEKDLAIGYGGCWMYIIGKKHTT